MIELKISDEIVIYRYYAYEAKIIFEGKNVKLLQSEFDSFIKIKLSRLTAPVIGKFKPGSFNTLLEKISGLNADETEAYLIEAYEEGLMNIDYNF